MPKTSRQYLLKAIKNYDRTISEVYSPPRVTLAARGAGKAYDLRNGWNFSKRTHRQGVLREIRELRPALLILSPPCTKFSLLQNLSKAKRDEAKFQEDLKEAKQHKSFCMELARLQMANGRGFLYEQPAGATSWQEDDVLELANHPDVEVIRCDLCQFSLRALGQLGIYGSFAEPLAL